MKKDTLNKISTAYIIISIFSVFFISFLQPDLLLYKLGVFGNAKLFITVNQLMLLPVVLGVFIIVFKLERNFSQKFISSLLSFVFVLRTIAYAIYIYRNNQIINMSLEGSGASITNSYIFVIPVLLSVLFALCFLALGFANEDAQITSLNILKVISIISLIIHGFFALGYFAFVFIGSEGFEQSSFLIMLTAELLNIFSFILTLFFVSHYRESIYKKLYDEKSK